MGNLIGNFDHLVEVIRDHLMRGSGEYKKYLIGNVSMSVFMIKAT